MARRRCRVGFGSLRAAPRCSRVFGPVRCLVGGEVMAGLDLDCGDAADALLFCADQEQRTMAVITSALAAEAQVLSAVADRLAGNHPRNPPRTRSRRVLSAGDAPPPGAQR